jgi:hypothetical protein
MQREKISLYIAATYLESPAHARMYARARWNAKKRARFPMSVTSDRKEGMNLRHAAALALVGWYLMLPPTKHPWSRDLWRWWTGSSNPIVKECNLDAPFLEWEESKE